MMKYFNSVLKMPVEFPENSRAGHLRIMSRFRALGNGWEYRAQYACNSIILSADRNIKLHAVRLFGSENREYSVNLTVRVSGSGVSVATNNGNFLSKHIRCEFGDYQGYDIMIEPPITLAANTDYIFYANISGPPSWYGFYGQCSVVHSGVNFSFRTHGIRTRVDKGQFSEFVFALL